MNFGRVKIKATLLEINELLILSKKILNFSMIVQNLYVFLMKYN